MFTFAIFETSRYWGRSCIADKVIKAREKSIKKWTHIHDKTHDHSQEFEACNKHGETPPWNVGDPKQCISRVIKSKQRKPLKQSQKWFDLPPQLIEIKAVRHVFRLCSIYSRNRKATGSRKHHYDDSELRRVLTFVAIGRKRKKRLRYGQKFSERTNSATVLYKNMTIAKLSSKINRLSKR